MTANVMTLYRSAAFPFPVLPPIALPKLPSWRRIQRGVNALVKSLVGAGLILASVTHTTAVRNGMADFVVDQLDEGTPPGHIVMTTAGIVTVATLTLSTTAFGASSGGTATAAAITSDSSAVGGTIALALFKNAAGVEKFRCSVTATGGGGDIEMNSVIVSAGQTVAITSLTYSAPT